MTNSADLPAVEVAVTLIQCQDDLLLIYNRNWEVFTFPMSRRRHWAFTDEAAQEPWIDAAARAVAECLGRTSIPEFLLETERVQVSDREGVSKRYHFGIFRERVSSPPSLAPGVIAEWIPLARIKHQRPVSPTALFLLEQLQRENLL